MNKIQRRTNLPLVELACDQMFHNSEHYMQEGCAQGPSASGRNRWVRGSAEALKARAQPASP